DPDQTPRRGVDDLDEDLGREEAGIFGERVGGLIDRQPEPPVAAYRRRAGLLVLRRRNLAGLAAEVARVESDPCFRHRDDLVAGGVVTAQGDVPGQGRLRTGGRRWRRAIEGGVADDGR